MTITTKQSNDLIKSDSAGINDFDFAIGCWKVTHRRRHNLLDSNSPWVEFSAESTTRKILGGYGNIEDNLLHFPDASFRAAAIRSFNPNSKLWSIWWLDDRFSDQISVPVVGFFQNHIGLFYAEELLGGRLTKVRFRWDATTPDKPKWEQAFSVDDGETWDINWLMSFTQNNK